MENFLLSLNIDLYLLLFLISTQVIFHKIKKTNKVGIVELKWNNTYLVKLKF